MVLSQPFILLGLEYKQLKLLQSPQEKATKEPKMNLKVYLHYGRFFAWLLRAQASDGLPSPLFYRVVDFCGDLFREHSKLKFYTTKAHEIQSQHRNNYVIRSNCTCAS